MTKPSPAFKNMLNQVERKEILSPLLYSYLREAKFPDEFTVVFKKAGKARKPDGYFHPSTHPTMTARQLFYYLTEPDKWEQEQLSYESRMAVTMGTAVHSFIEMCLRDDGIMIPLTGTCPACHRPHGSAKGQCDEYGAADETLGSRGHMDGVINLDVDGKHWVAGVGGFEFKTTNPQALMKVQSNDLAAFKKKWPVYYAQIQEYMRISGLRQFIVMFFAMGYPWTPMEFQVPFDPAHSLEIERKYQLVREHEQLGTPPDACCPILSAQAKSCEARFSCPVGIASRS